MIPLSFVPISYNKFNSHNKFTKQNQRGRKHPYVELIMGGKNTFTIYWENMICKIKFHTNKYFIVKISNIFKFSLKCHINWNFLYYFIK